jgi:AraC family transcriptional regulator
MALDILVKRVQARCYVGVRRVVKHDGLGPLCGEVYPRLSALLAERGAAPDGPPAMVYHSVNQQTGDFDVQPILFVKEVVDGAGDIEAGETPAGEALFACHVGPYGKLGETWGAVFARARELGRPVTKRSWEVYVDLPGAVEEANMRTEIYAPIDEA